MSILKPIWRARWQLLSTFVLFYIGCYLFTLVAFEFYWNDFDYWCDTIEHCYLTVSDYAFKKGGGIGGWLTTM